MTAARTPLGLSLQLASDQPRTLTLQLNIFNNGDLGSAAERCDLRPVGPNWGTLQADGIVMTRSLPTGIPAGEGGREGERYREEAA